MKKQLSETEKEVKTDVQQMSDSISKALRLVERFVYTKDENSIYYKGLVKKHQKEIEKKLWIISAVIIISSIVIGLVVGVILDFFFNLGDDTWAIVLFIVLIGVMGGISLASDTNVNRVASRKTERQAKKTLEEIYDVELDDENTLDQLIDRSIEIATSDEYKDRIVPVLINEIAVEILLAKEDPITKDQIKRLVYTIISGTFILESLNLDVLVKEEKTLTILMKVLKDIKTNLSSLMEIEPTTLLSIDFSRIRNSIKDVEGVVKTLQLINSDKELAVDVEEITGRIKKQLDKKPIAKSAVKILAKDTKKINKNKLLSTISAFDGEVLEIRTRAGTYYTTAKVLERTLPAEDKRVELLTDREIAVKIEVLNSTLELLEEEKKSISKKDYDIIKNDYLMQLMSAEQILKKRSGSFKFVICPNCGTKNSSIKQFCKKCKNQLPYCIICLSSIGVGTEVSICPHCQSFAHAEHFAQWLAKTDICPYCKEKITKKLEIDVIEKITKIKKSH